MTSSLSPDAALMLLTVGVLLVYVEMNRPGLILPGAFGLTLILLFIARSVRQQIPPCAACTGLLGFMLLAYAARIRKQAFPALAATAALMYSFLHLAPPSAPVQIHPAVALGCAAFLGAGTFLLTTIAARARQNKGLDSLRSSRKV